MKNIASLSVDISKYGDRVIDNLIKAQSNTAYVIQQDAKFYCEDMGTGAYADSIQISETEYDGATITTKVYSDATVSDLRGNTYSLGELIENGTRPHLIEPLQAQALHFTKGGKDIFAKYVFHPGTVAQPHLIPALQKNIALYKSNIRKALKEAE